MSHTVITTPSLNPELNIGYTTALKHLYKNQEYLKARMEARLRG